MAMLAYAPLAVSVFGNATYPLQSRLALGRSLVLSRLGYGIHVWSFVPLWSLKQVNDPYMRFLRRVAGEHVRKSGGLTDLQVRQRLAFPSVDCFVSQNRLCYLQHLVRSNAEILIAMLAHRPKLPWVNLVEKDLSGLFASQRFRLSELGDPRQNQAKWLDFMCSFPNGWKQIVRKWVFHESALDRSQQRKMLPKSSSFPCVPCGLFFDSRRALEQHQRSVHGRRSSVKHWANSTGKCVVCGSVFSTRLRLVAHLTESRTRYGKRPCREFLHLFPPLSGEAVRELDLLDSKARRDARHRGHTQPLSSAPAELVYNKSNRKRTLPQVSSPPKRCRITFKQPRPEFPPPPPRKVRRC